LFFVVLNLCQTGSQTHEWLLKKFDDYPKNRKAVIPFVY